VCGRYIHNQLKFVGLSIVYDICLGRTSSCSSVLFHALGILLLMYFAIQVILIVLKRTLNQLPLRFVCFLVSMCLYRLKNMLLSTVCPRRYRWLSPLVFGALWRANVHIGPSVLTTSVPWVHICIHKCTLFSGKLHKCTLCVLG
jgi:hypothetical protein